jgi:putative NADH-flavin reductase
VAGDPRDSAALAAALPGHDAVLSALGLPARQALRPHTLIADCATATVRAMATAGVTRLGIVSVAVLFPEKGLRFAFFRWFLRHIAHDMTAMEATVRASGLDWTIARPPRLVQSAETTYRARRDALPPGSMVTSFRAVANFLIESVEQHSHSHEIVGLAR